MRNLLWTATAVLVMLIGGGNVLAQVAVLLPPTVVPKVNKAAVTPPGKEDCYAEGTYTLPPQMVANKVIAKWYEEQAGTGNLIWKGDTDHILPAGGNYKTGDIRLDKGKKYTVIVTFYIDGPGGVNDPVQSGPSRIATGFAP